MPKPETMTRREKRESPAEIDTGEPCHQNQSSFATYRDFICYRIREDALSYCNAAFFMAGEQKRGILRDIAAAKFDSIAIPELLAPGMAATIRTRTEHLPGSLSRYMLDVDSRPVNDLQGLFRFIMQRETRTLELFKRFSLSVKGSAATAMFINAAGRQQQGLDRIISKYHEFLDETHQKEFRTEGSAVSPGSRDKEQMA